VTASSDKSPNRSVIGSSFNVAAQWTSRQCGRASTFAVACITIVVWAVTGPLFHYSNTWQLVINTGTTIITFLMVFLIQNTQNRDSAVLHLKLDELIRVSSLKCNLCCRVPRLPAQASPERVALGRLSHLSKFAMKAKAMTNDSVRLRRGGTARDGELLASPVTG